MNLPNDGRLKMFFVGDLSVMKTSGEAAEELRVVAAPLFGEWLGCVPEKSLKRFVRIGGI